MLSRNVTFGKALDMKSPCSWQMKSSQTRRIPLQVEMDVSPQSLGSSALGEILVDVT